MLEKVCNWFVIFCIVTFGFCPLPTMGLDFFGQTLRGLPCEGPEQGFGPYDYFDINDPKKPLWQEGRLWEIDKIHYGEGIKDKNHGRLEMASKQFQYTVMAIPNHPNALYAIIQLDIEARKNLTKTKERWPNYNGFTPPECWLQRALAFRPKQAHIYLLFGLYFHKIGLKDQALEYYRQAVTLQPENSETHYNIGLLYFERKEYVLAKEHAKRAYQLGYPLPGLRKKLVSVGQWP